MSGAACRPCGGAAGPASPPKEPLSLAPRRQSRRCCATALSSAWVRLPLVFAAALTAVATAPAAAAGTARPHTSNHAVIVSSSRYWFNYRHAVNALSIYNILRSNGVPDSNIVLMLADEYAVSPRNPLPNFLGAEGAQGTNLFANVTIDYRGDDVRVEQLLQVLAGASYSSSSSTSPVLNTDAHSNILVYLTGHGGDQFFKFQDSEEILASQLASVFRQMHDASRYHRVLLLADTCQAFTLGSKIDAPNVAVVGSSLKGESSYAHHTDDTLGLSVVERYTHALVQFLRKQRDLRGPSCLSQLTLRQGLVEPYPYESQRAHVGFQDGDGGSNDAGNLPLSDFFAQVEAAAPPDSQQRTARLLPDRPGRSPFRHWNAAPRRGERRPEEPPTSTGPGECRDDRWLSTSTPLPRTRQWWRWSVDGPGDAFAPMEPTDGAFVALLVGVATLTVAWINRGTVAVKN